jgi:hypothetical protein
VVPNEGIVQLANGHADYMRRNLSSPIITLFWKFVFPACWMGLVSVATYAAWFRPEQWQNGGSPSERWGTLAMLLFGMVFLVPHAARLCRVRLSEDGLAISNWWRDAHIPFAAIADVEFRPLRGPPRIWLTLRLPTNERQ